MPQAIESHKIQILNSWKNIQLRHLDLSTREKPVLIPIPGGTATRPHALVYRAKNERTATGYCIGEEDNGMR
jgi:hypothetical protein